MAGRVLVTGASSAVGAEVLGLLVERGVPVRAVSRSRRRVEAWRAQGIDAAVGDLFRLDPLLEGCDRLFLLSGAQPDQLDQDRAGIDAAARAGVRLVVKMSSGDAEVHSPIPWARSHAHSDAYLAARKLPYTILKPSAFASNLLESAPAIRRGLLPQCSGRGATGWIDPKDIAACAGAALTEEGHVGRTYVITGPEALSFPTIARRCTDVVGHRVRAPWLPGPLYYLLLRATGQSPWRARALVAQFADVVRSGRDDPGVTGTVQEITGLPPAPIDDYLRRTAEFRRGFAA